MPTSNRALRHVWTKEEEGTLVECLMELVSMRGWKSNNGTFRPSYLAQLVRMMVEKLPGCQSHPAAKGLLKKSFPYYDELTYVFDRNKAMDQFAETFTDMGSNEPGGYDRFDMGDGNEEFPPVYSQGIDLSEDDVRASRPSRASEALDQTNEQLRQIAEWPERALANDNHVRTEFFWILREMRELTSLDRTLLQRHLLSRMDDLRGFILMLEDEREEFCRVLLRDITR
ncbi:retrotransposon protein [Cucumis melo var. makuwa]|uniref:Retrotransposon protein n=1 Tax=Cucumis melo var. makuwa TaxID=1194695 RepID=A0A5A7UPF7_CUCMM|nr:retrotransposon protein [Cucumis melo var. makuwa]TYK08923.1 retrotransposon protein [Cucumis melo var. makuwa]